MQAHSLPAELFGAELASILAQKYFEQEDVLLLEIFLPVTGKSYKVAIDSVVGWTCSWNKKELARTFDLDETVDNVRQAWAADAYLNPRVYET